MASDLNGNQSRKTTAWGVYGSFDWNFVENWEVSLSARYQEEDYTARFDNIVNTNLAPQLASNITPCIDPPAFLGLGTCENPITAPDRIKGSDNFSAFNPKATVSWFATDSVMLYTSVAKGTKPGGFSFESLLQSDDRFYDEEKLLSYEFGWKTSWFDDRMIVNGAAFYMTNEDKQANNTAYETPLGAPSGVRTPITYVDNIGRTEVKGLELSVDTILTNFLSINAAYAYTDTSIEHYNTLSAKGVVSGDVNACSANAASGAADPDCDLSGNELPFTAKHSLNVSFNFDWGMGDSLDGFSSILGRYRSDRYIDTDNLIELDSYVQWDANIGVRSDSFEVLAYIDNAFDDDTTTDAVSFVNFAQNFETLVVAYPYTKRTYGVRFKYMF
jgi:iron complex outermembrane receptor protein